MSSQERSINSDEEPATNNDPANLSIRRTNFKNINVKTSCNRESTITSSGTSVKDSTRSAEKEEAKLSFTPLTEKASTDKIEVEPNAFHYFPPTEIINLQDGSQSPFPMKRYTIPQPDFNEIIERGEPMNHGEDDSPKSHFSCEIFSRLKTDYEIIEIIGKGSFGIVFKCINKLDRNEYAIKKPKRDFSGRYQDYCLDEISALAKLTNLEDNSHVVRYYHSWIENLKLFLVMEYCPSSLTKERENKNTFSEIELKKILRDLCLGLSYLHRNQLVHLDVKTENILISKTGRYKLGDLGHTKQITQGVDFDEGDSRYQAPEFLDCHIPKEKRDYTKVDIFSLGMTLLELATNHDLPKKGSEWREVREDKFYRLDKVTNLSQSFKNLIKKMLKKDPSQRPSADELLNKYLLTNEEIDAKWERVARDLLEKEKKDLELKLQNKKRRGKSIDLTQ